MRRLSPFLGTVLLAAAGAVAAPTERPTLTKLVNESELVFRGVVERLDYTLAQPADQSMTQVPYTFVTYRVTEVLRGNAGGPTVTLLFYGGFDHRDQTYSSSSISPGIDVGDNDILFVTGNGKRLVPLVGNLDGRYRIVDGQVYTELGNAVTINVRGDLDIGDMYDLPHVKTTTVNGHVFVVKHGPELAALPSPAATVGAVRERVLALSAVAPPAGTFASADPAKPVIGPSLTPAAPPADPFGVDAVQPVLEPQTPDAPAPRKS